MADNFFRRWMTRKAAAQTDASRRAGDADPARDTIPETGNTPNHAALPSGERFPTLDDVARLSSESDYSPFISGSVDQEVRRAAMKKLFSDPHFNLMDGLDIYIDDYNKPDPMSAAMLAALDHSKNLFQLRKPEDEHDAENVSSMNTASDLPEESSADPVDASLASPAQDEHAAVKTDAAYPRSAS